MFNKLSTQLFNTINALLIATISSVAFAQNTLVGSTPAEFNVASGAVGYSVPIQVVPGRGGMQPELSLNYSGGGNGILGVGWSLGGLSAIHRCPRTIAQDGQIGRVNFDGNDRYCLDGQRLIPVTGTDGGMGVEYRTEVDSYSKITSYGGSDNNPNYWIVRTKSGQVITYGGNNGDASVVFPGKGTLTWAVAEINDTTGNNPVTFIYDIVDNYQYLYQLRYAGNTIKVNYESRSDIIEYMMLGYPVTIDRRLKNIELIRNSKSFKTYQVHYQENTDYALSTLNFVKECHLQNCYKPTTFDYDSSGFSYSTVPTSKPSGGHGGTYQKHTDDYNADGITDIALIHWSSDHGWVVKTALGKGDGTFATSVTSKPSGGHGGSYQQRSGDYNGDGVTDIALIHWSDKHGWVVKTAISKGDGTFATSVTSKPSGGHGGSYQQHSGDYNGDGITDIALIHWSDKYGWIAKTALGKGDGTFAASVTSKPSGGHGGAYQQHSGDYNADGITDIALIHWSSAHGWVAKIALGNGDGTFASSVTSKPSGGHGGTYEQHSGDYNGDGITDIALIHWSSEHGWVAKIALGKGNGTFAASVTSKPSGGHGGAYEQHSDDYNGDGITDIALIHWSSEHGWVTKTALGKGDGTFAASVTRKPSGGHGGDYEQFSGDYNGDGVTDIALIHWSDKHGWHAKVAVSNARFIKLDNIRDANNNETQIDYRLLTDSTFYTKGLSSRYPLVSIQPPQYVVSEVKTSNGIGGTTKVQYQYEDLKAHVQGRGSYGYAKITETYPATGKQQITTFDQRDFPYTGSVLNVVEKYNNQTVNEAVNTMTASQNSAGVYQLNLQKSVQKSYELGSSNPVTTVTTTHSNIDNYGNIGRVTVATSGNHQTFTKITDSTYTNDTATWYLGRLTKAKVTHQSPYGADDIRRSEFTYDADTGLLKTESIIGAETGKLLTTTHYSYDAYGQKKKVTLAASGEVDRVSTTAYNSLGQPTQSCNALGQCETYTYTPEGWLASTKGPNGITTKWTYDGFGRKLREDRADGTWTKINHYFASSGQCGDVGNFVYTCTVTQTSTSQPAIIQYDALGREVRKIKQGFDERLVYSDVEYNRLAQVSRVSRDYYVGDHIYWATSEYDALGRVIRATEPGPHGSTNDITTEYNGLITTVRSGPEQLAKTTITNAIGQKVRIEEEEDTYTQYTYNSDGNLLTTRVAGDAATTITLSYDEFGRKTGMDDPDMGQWSYRYNAFSQLISQTDAKGQTVSMTYDVLGRMISRAEPEGTSTWTYGNNSATKGSIGKLLQESGHGLTKDYRYDSLGRPVSTKTTIAGQGSFTSATSYDNLGRVKRTSYPGSQNFYTENQYNENGFLTAVTGLRAHAESHDYSTLRPLIHEATTLADDYLSKANKLRNLGNYYQSLLDDYRHASGSGTLGSTAINKLKQHEQQLQNTVNQGQAAVKKTSNEKFLPVFMIGGPVVPIVTQSVKMELPPQLLEHVNNAIVELEAVQKLIANQVQGYQQLANQLIVLTEQTLAAADHSFQYERTLDTAASVYGELLAQENTNTITYWRAADVDASGRISAEVYGNGIVNDYAYNQATGQLQSIHSSLLVFDPVRHLEYQYDAYQNVTLRDDLVNDIQETYRYDRLDRLTETTVSSGLYSATSDLNTVQSLSYDVLGNIRSKSDVGNYSYGENGAGIHAVTSTTGGGSAGSSFQYDPNGNMTTGDGRSIQWSSFNKPTHIIRNSKSATFSYGPSRARYQKVNHLGDTTLYVGSLYERLAKHNGGIDQKHYIYAAGQLVAEHIVSTTEGSQTRYLHKDALGSVDLVTDAYANVVDKRSFDAWGKLRELPWKSTASLNDPLYLTQLPFTNKGYTGHENVQEVALIHMNGRMYDATLARFISADPHIQAGSLSQSYNRYSYVMNNPLKYTDPSGYFFKKLRKKIKRHIKKYSAISRSYDRKYRNYHKFRAEQERFLRRKWVQQVGYVAAIACGPFYAVCAGGHSAAIADAYGADFNDAAKAGVKAGVSAYITQSAGQYSGGNWFTQAVVRGTAGGVASEIQGGQFKDGFKVAFVLSVMDSAAMAMREKMIAQSKLNAEDNLSGQSAGYRGDGVKLAGGRATEYTNGAASWTELGDPSPLGGHQGGQGYIFGIKYAPGSLADRVVEAYAGPHDYLNSSYWYLPNGNVNGGITGFAAYAGEALNYANVVVATPIVAASVLSPYTASISAYNNIRQ